MLFTKINSIVLAIFMMY